MKPGTKQVMENENGRTITWKNLILATGSRPVEIPHFKFEGRVIDSTGGLNLQEVPEESAVMGDAYICTE
ncbi:FAD-dependent oxidoreductase [Limosilactobacillus reuteri]|uniref:FAD-dependent oxidoreductase n=1 Tax=Limosilactobacillus reuteri TaxID=1598 RepID=UPI001CDA7DAE|nr:FAD-dependent oxidoreductase [Limosilactobacillus reuteri]